MGPVRQPLTKIIENIGLNGAASISTIANSRLALGRLTLKC